MKKMIQRVASRYLSSSKNQKRYQKGVVDQMAWKRFDQSPLKDSDEKMYVVFGKVYSDVSRDSMMKGSNMTTEVVPRLTAYLELPQVKQEFTKHKRSGTWSASNDGSVLFQQHSQGLEFRGGYSYTYKFTVDGKPINEALAKQVVKWAEKL
jgi:hypothetical protein